MVADECECLLERRALRALPEQYHQASLSDFPEETLREIYAWAADPRQGLVVFGLAGRGKTYLAAAICRSMILIRKRALFRRAFQFFSEARHALSSSEEETVFANYTTPHYLLLDDLEIGHSDFERRFLLELIDRQLGHLRPTCITTNLTLAQIGQQLDERVGSRLSEFRWIHLDGPDLRQFPKTDSPMIIEITDQMRTKVAGEIAEFCGVGAQP